MNENDYTKKERAAAKKVVAQMMDGGKTESMLEEMAKKLTQFTETNKDENGFILLAHAGDIGKVFCAVAGKPVTLCAMLDMALDDADILENVVDKVTTIRAMQKLFGAISGKRVKPKDDNEDDD